MMSNIIMMKKLEIHNYLKFKEQWYYHDEETLYLGGNHVRVVCERVWRKAQECARKKGLVIGESPKVAHV